MHPKKFRIYRIGWLTAVWISIDLYPVDMALDITWIDICIQLHVIFFGFENSREIAKITHEILIKFLSICLVIDHFVDWICKFSWQVFRFRCVGVGVVTVHWAWICISLVVNTIVAIVTISLVVNTVVAIVTIRIFVIACVVVIDIIIKCRVGVGYILIIFRLSIWLCFAIREHQVAPF